jgi:hypothetical protein
VAESPKKTAGARKKTVRVETEASTESVDGGSVAASWTPTPEAKKKAVTLRLIALGMWALAIAGEAFAIFWMLRQTPFTNTLLIWLIVLIVVIGALAIGGSLLWKQANRLDPASKQDKFRFFVQNQLGLIIAIIAFLPLIILVFTNKNMSGQQKAIAGSIGVVVALAAAFFGTSINPPSVEQYTAETNQITSITGSDLVYWTTSGRVFHLCEEARFVNLESEDNTIFEGTVAEAYAAGKSMPAQRTIEQESEECGFTYVEPTPAPTP